MKNVLISLILIASTSLFFSCNKDNSNPSKSNVQLIVKSGQTVPVKSQGFTKASSGLITTLTVDSFMVNIGRIKFDIDEVAEGISEDVTDSIIEAQELQGPYLINLLDQKTLDGLSIGTTLIPNATYESLKIKFERCLDNTKPTVYNRSVYITGTLNGTPLKFWTTEEFEYKIEFPDSSSFVLTGDNLKMYLDMNINQIVSTINQFDFSSVKDGNNNGIFEIGPDDTDGNTQLSHYIADALKDAIDLDKEND
jgi:hypothetical protein